jgi:hypothetical protein
MMLKLEKDRVSASELGNHFGVARLEAKLLPEVLRNNVMVVWMDCRLVGLEPARRGC